MSNTASAPIKRQVYEKRLERVANYIVEHLDEDIDLNQLAEIANMSPYHWHRVYHAVQGETIAATVKRLRLFRAAGLLAQTDLSLEEIGKRSGYPTAPSFSRAFKTLFGVPPGRYRETGTHQQFIKASQKGDATMFPVNVKSIESINLITAGHQGAYMDISKTFGNLFGWMGSRDLIAPDARMIGIFYDDPDAVAEAELRSRACMSIPDNFSEETPFEVLKIESADYAVLEYTGPYSDMKAAYTWMFGTWLVESGREPANEPCFEEYLNNPQNTPPAELRTNIHLPLA